MIGLGAAGVFAALWPFNIPKDSSSFLHDSSHDYTSYAMLNQDHCVFIMGEKKLPSVRQFIIREQNVLVSFAIFVGV